jgi:transposase
MAKTRPPYTPEFRRQLVELVRAGRSPDELARQFERPHSRSGTGSRRRSATRAAATTD